MSGIEVAGLLLGAFPLIISALEHYEDTKRVTTTWWRIKRAHKKDMGRVKDCQLKFTLNLKELLLPLLLDGVVNKGEYEVLLANPGGMGWKEHEVHEALSNRLAECHERYVDILQEMVGTMARLGKSCRVDDAHFQETLKRRSEKTNESPANAQAQLTLMFRANASFEMKRIAYAFSGDKRDDLLAEIEACNSRLQDVLAANDRLSALTESAKPSGSRRLNSKALAFWRHAESIFNVLDSIWQCTCRSKAHLRLHHQTTADVSMKLQLRLCHGQQSMRIRLSDAPPVLKLGTPSGLGTLKKSPQVIVRSSSNSSTSSLPSTADSLQLNGLCQVCGGAQHSGQTNVCLGNVSDGDNEYAIYDAVGGPSILASQTSLADLLLPQPSLRLTRVQRYRIALTLASSHLQLHSTPWLQEQWRCEEVCFPTDAKKAILLDEPYILAGFNPSSSTSSSKAKDRSFSTLGIVLLELCFGVRLENHPLWLKPLYAPGKGDPMMRQTVACEWLEEVEGEAGEDYATAVTWTLRQAPSTVKDDKWRSDFAQNVVQPLQRHYDYLNPKKSSTD